MIPVFCLSGISFLSLRISARPSCLHRKCRFLDYKRVGCVGYLGQWLAVDSLSVTLQFVHNSVSFFENFRASPQMVLSRRHAGASMQ